MRYYVGINLHSDSIYAGVIDNQDRLSHFQIFLFQQNFKKYMREG